MTDNTHMSAERIAQRIVLTVNARVGDVDLHGGNRDFARRRTDFGELAAALGASIVDWGVIDRTRLGRVVRRWIGFGPPAALLVFMTKRRYDAIWCFTEIEGLLLALLFKIFRVRTALFFIAVEPVSPKSLFFLTRLKVWTHFTAILPTNTYQAEELVRLGVPKGKVTVLPYQVDCRYFTNTIDRSLGSDRPMVVAVGLESRDYVTLVRAVTDLDVDVFVAAASLWSEDRAQFPVTIPSNVTVGKFSYQELKELYARAALAVVPLQDSPYQHGITAIQEAMAMGLPIVVTRTRGQSDVVIDRRRVLRKSPELNTSGSFAQLFEPSRAELQQSNGFYVAPKDAAELRKCICYLVEHRDIAAELGSNAQRYARELLSVERFVERAVNLIEAACDSK
jgi:glycosyltransferase involved in cell wall biosynthesis